MKVGNTVFINDNYPISLFIGKKGIVKWIDNYDILVEFSSFTFWLDKEYVSKLNKEVK